MTIGQGIAVAAVWAFLPVMALAPRVKIDAVGVIVILCVLLYATGIICGAQ